MDNQDNNFSLLDDKAISQVIDKAIDEHRIIAFYQPQYDHASRMLVGVEALARWDDPNYGSITPRKFIHAVEHSDIISKLDLSIFRQICKFLRSCLSNRIPLVPIYTNVASWHIFKEDFIEQLEAIRQEFDIPTRYLRLEITETVAPHDTEAINTVIAKLHDLGYKVCMDDFGVGHSSLNVLKDIDIDVLKIDMELLNSNHKKPSRGAAILSSIVRLSKWLNLPVIAEGVETRQQADFLLSIGCNVVQGFYYSTPMNEKSFAGLLREASISENKRTASLNKFANLDFWSPNSNASLIFNELMGGTAIFLYKNGKTDILRVNKKFLRELCMNLHEEDVVGCDLIDYVATDNRTIFVESIKEAINTCEESSCNTKWQVCSHSCGDAAMYIHSVLRVINRNNDEYMLFLTISNISISQQKQLREETFEKHFNRLIEQAKIYYWEYDIITKDMYPCFRCIRDLGLPTVVHNYPEPAIAIGIIPPAFADMYREWHRQLAQGACHLEATIPLTVGLIPFTIRYDTEFDENGRPIKAYASATPVLS